MMITIGFGLLGIVSLSVVLGLNEVPLNLLNGFLVALAVCSIVIATISML